MSGITEYSRALVGIHIPGSAEIGSALFQLLECCILRGFLLRAAIFHSLSTTCGCSIFWHQSGIHPLFSTIPTNNGTLRYPFVGRLLLHLLDWCITGCFLVLFAFFTPLLHVATCIYGWGCCSSRGSSTSSRHPSLCKRLASALATISCFLSLLS